MIKKILSYAAVFVLIIISVIIWINAYKAYEAATVFTFSYTIYAVPVVEQIAIAIIIFFLLKPDKFKKITGIFNGKANKENASSQNGKSLFMTIVWLFPLLGAFYSIFYYNSVKPESAPQQAAMAAMALVYCIIPYIIARAIQELNNNK